MASWLAARARLLRVTPSCLHLSLMAARFSWLPSRIRVRLRGRLSAWLVFISPSSKGVKGK